MRACEAAKEKRGRGPCKDPPEVVLAVLHQGTVWFTHHPRDSNPDHRSSGETVSSFNRSISSTARLLLRNSKEQLGRHSKSHQWCTHATTMGRLGTSLRNVACQGSQFTSYSSTDDHPAEVPAEGPSAAIWPRQLHHRGGDTHGRGSSYGYCWCFLPTE
jgi:hypothetical protein